MRSLIKSLVVVALLASATGCIIVPVGHCGYYHCR